MKVKLLFVPMAIVISVVVSIWMTKPTYDSLKSNKNEIKKIEKELATVSQQRQAMQQAKSSYESLDSDQKLIDNALPEEKNPEDLYAELVSKLTEANFFTNKISFSTPKEVKKTKNAQDSQSGFIDTVAGNNSSKKGEESEVLHQNQLNEFSITLDGIGGYPELQELIASIYAMNRYIKISSLEITKAVKNEEENPEANQNNGLLQIKIITNGYFERPEDSQQVVKLASTKNYVMKGLMSGQVNMDIIEKYKQRRTMVPFNFPFTNEGVGKTNLFVR